MRSHYLRMVSNNSERTVIGAASARGTSAFALVELMVSIGIMVLVLSVVMARHDAFNSASLLRNQAYDVALKIREIQLIVVGAQNDGSGFFRASYGLVFTEGESRYTVFRDGAPSGTPDGDYDAGEETEVQGRLDPRFVVGSMTKDGQPVVGPLEILFVRPNFDAIMRDDAGAISVPVTIQVALKSDPTNRFRTIEITPAGQITVE